MIKLYAYNFMTRLFYNVNFFKIESEVFGFEKSKKTLLGATVQGITKMEEIQGISK